MQHAAKISCGIWESPKGLYFFFGVVVRFFWVVVAIICSDNAADCSGSPGLLMVVGLLLKADVEVCFEAVAVFGEQEEPFEHIPQIEADVEQLPLLSGVDTLVVELHGIELLHGEDDAKEVDGIKATHERETPNVDYLGHLQKLYGKENVFRE